MWSKSKAIPDSGSKQPSVVRRVTKTYVDVPQKIMELHQFVIVWKFLFATLFMFLVLYEITLVGKARILSQYYHCPSPEQGEFFPSKMLTISIKETAPDLHPQHNQQNLCVCVRVKSPLVFHRYHCGILAGTVTKHSN